MLTEQKNILLTLSIGVVSWFVFYFETIFSMVNIWWTSDTFAHGMLIFPISIYLIWQKRHLFIETKKQANPFVFIILLGLSILWMFAATVDVQVIKQLSIVLMLPAFIGAIYGLKILKVYAFPLFYLIFAVPFGEFLIPQLQQVTALITVLGLELTGIPVYIEGMYISIPTGDFEVAVACSGIRYLIASFALGILYAYLTYQKLSKRLIFIAVSLVIPIVANGIRAYGIVMIAHLSDMKYATGVDHLIYGWLFFGIVIFLLFYIGSFWRDEEKVETNTSKETNKKLETSSTELELLTPSIVAIIIISTGPLFNSFINSQQIEPIRKFNISTKASGDWKPVITQNINWAPTFKGNDKELKNYFENNGNIISNYMAYYQFQTQTKELINQGNHPYTKDNNKLISQEKEVIKFDGANLDIDTYQVINHLSGQQRFIIGWYYVFGQEMLHPITIKIVQAIGKITGLAKDGFFIGYAIDYTQDEEKAKRDLLLFIKNHWPKLKKELDE